VEKLEQSEPWQTLKRKISSTLKSLPNTPATQDRKMPAKLTNSSFESNLGSLISTKTLSRSPIQGSGVVVVICGSIRGEVVIAFPVSVV